MVKLPHWFGLLTLILGTTVSLWAQDGTRTYYFPRIVYGDGSVSTLSTCNSSQEAVFEEVVIRESATAAILHQEQGLILGQGCNIRMFIDPPGGRDIAIGYLEQNITGMLDVKILSSVFMRLNVTNQGTEEVRINPEQTTSEFTFNFSESVLSRNGIAIVDASGTGFSCDVGYRDSLGNLIQGAPVQAGPNEAAGLFLDETVSGLPDGFGWVRFDCDSEVSAITLGQNPASGNLSIGRIFAPEP